MSTEDVAIIRTTTGAERKVLDALHGLPDGYNVAYRPAGMTIESEDLAERYEPDIVVSDPEGRTVLVEVKSPQSMSWSNMANFVQIDRSARNAGTSFLVLVPEPQAAPIMWPAKEFDEVNVSYGNDEATMVRAVIDALHKSTSAKQRD